MWSITRVKTDEKAKREKSFAGIEGTRLRFYIYFVKRQVLNGFNTVLGVEFIEHDEACDCERKPVVLGEVSHGFKLRIFSD